MGTAAVRLGELLEKRGDITREQLLRALRNQKVLGGRLGTCLLEIEALSEERLCSALAHQQGVPCATPDELRGIPDDILDLLPSKIAKRCQAIAFHASSTQVKVALIDARNLAIQDEISFVVGKRIRWHVAPELRLLEALEKHHGEECPARVAKLLDKLNRSRFLWAREGAAGGTAESSARRAGDQLHWDSSIAGVAAAGAQSPPAENPISVELPHFQHQALDLPIVAPIPPPGGSQVGASGARPRTSSPAAAPLEPAAGNGSPAPSQQSTAAEPSASAVRRPAAVTQPAAQGTRNETPGPAANSPRTPRALPPRCSVAEAEQRLLSSRVRDDVARALFDFAAGLAQRAVLFFVRKGEIAPWMWSEHGTQGDQLSALRLSVSQPSLFSGLREPGAIFRGRLSPLPAHAALAACFAPEAILGDLVVLPVKVKERLVAALLVELRAETGASLAVEQIADLQRVIAKAEIAFELCIMQSKLRKA